jgi:hypothetical protein
MAHSPSLRSEKQGSVHIQARWSLARHLPHYLALHKIAKRPLIPGS